MRHIISGKLLGSKAAQPAEKPFEIPDKRLGGFLLRVQPSGVRSYVVQIGRGRRVTLGKVGELSPEIARERATIVLGNVAADRPPLHGLDGGSTEITLGQFIGTGEESETVATYRRWVFANHPKSAARTLQRLESCFGSKWYSRPLSEITVERIESWRTTRLSAGRSPNTVLRDIMTLSKPLTLAVRWKKLAANPVRDVEKPKLDRNPKVRFLDVAEEQRLRMALAERDAEMQAERESANVWRSARKRERLPPLPHFGDHLAPAVLVSMNSGLRLGELLSLKWASVEITGKHPQITIEGSTAKSGQTRHVPLNSEAVDVLRKWREQNPEAERVFPIDSSFKTAWAALLVRAKISSFRWHDLRHHFASRLVQQSVPLNTVRELLGHGSLSVTLRYAHLAPDQQAEAVAKLTQPRT